MQSCDYFGCKEPGTLKCSQCRLARYCSKEHQRKSWKKHKSQCSKPEEGGYPTEPLTSLYDRDSNASEILHLTDKETKKFLRASPLIFANMMKLKAGCPCIVDWKQFSVQWEALTLSVFNEWDDSLWENVLVAGGSVLMCLLPPHPLFTRRKASSIIGNFDFVFHSYFEGIPLEHYEPSKDINYYMQNVRWPAGDIDLFIYGLSAEAADRKLQAVFAALRAAVMKQNPSAEVVFVKTANTVTMVAPAPYRKIQIINRLYHGKSNILNGFDIDCVCVGYDGKSVLATNRAIIALRTKTNTINLEIRGQCYENRLLKYAQRGFAIKVPELRNITLDSEYLSFKLEEGWSGHETMTGDGWSKWSESANLARLLMAEKLGKSMNLIDKPFASRMKKEKERENFPFRYNYHPNAATTVMDTYPSKDNTGCPIWPATSSLSLFHQLEGAVGGGSSGKFKIDWKVGNMPRKPLSWEQWSKEAQAGGTKERYKYDWKAEEAKRKKKENEKKERERVAFETQRKKELDAVRREAEGEHANRRQALEREKRQAQLAAQEARRELKDAKEKALASEEEDACIVCLDEKKCIVYEPCNHLCLCKSCSLRIKQCPACQVPTKTKRRVFT